MRTRTSVGVLLGLFVAIAILLSAPFALAETLSWSAPTTYTDGSSIGTATVSYSAWWSTDAAMTVKNYLGTTGTSSSRTFSIDTESMPRGSTIYFSCNAIVAGTPSANATPLSWTVPNKAPSAPSNLRIN